MKEQQLKREKAAIDEIKEAVGQGKTTTDLFEIYQAVKEGRGDLLIAYSDYSLAVKMSGATGPELVDDATQPGVIDDITSEIAREVILKKGRVVFTDSEAIKGMGDIVLKVRY